MLKSMPLLIVLHFACTDQLRFMYLLLFVVLQPNSGVGFLIVEISRSHTIRHTHTRTHPIEFLWGRHQLFVEAAAYITHNMHEQWISMRSARFDPTIPAIKRLCYRDPYLFLETLRRVNSRLLIGRLDAHKSSSDTGWSHTCLIFCVPCMMNMETIQSFQLTRTILLYSNAFRLNKGRSSWNVQCWLLSSIWLLHLISLH
jgi:hypothetical protein